MNEDYVEYRLYPNKASKELARLVDDYYVHLSSYLLEYLWENEGFTLRVRDGDGKIPPHIYGRTKLGESIDDEWFIVFLLTELTKQFTNLIVRVTDNDGDFLLIEMAENLPEWLTPETAENRVFIYQGSIHIIPQQQKLTEQPEIVEAIQIVRNSPQLTRCNVHLQSPVFKRLDNYPSKIKEDQHVAHCYLPAILVALLKKDPTLISPAVRAFYSRDAFDIKICRKMKFFPPKVRVMTAVTFTKCLYAQLSQQNYSPDNLLGWNIPVIKSPHFKSYDIGMKVACGFEILVANCIEESECHPTQAELNLEERWQRYVKSLKSKGYFRGELEGSKIYTELLEKAQQYYCVHILEGPRDNSEIGQRILSMLDSLDVDVDKFKEEEKNLQPADDDSWLDMTPEKFDRILQERFNSMDINEFPKDISTEIVGGLKRFIQHPSGIDGAEFPSRITKQCAKGIFFEPEEFADAVQSTLGFTSAQWEGGSNSETSNVDSDDDEFNDDFVANEGDEKAKAQKLLNEMEAYMEQMDRELAKTKVGQSFDRLPPQKGNGSPGKYEDIDDYTPIDPNSSALRNILESFNSQQGLAGPASNILNSMGIPLPQNAEELD